MNNRWSKSGRHYV